jgi:phage shock protein A
VFDDLRAAFRQAIENFNRELHRDQIPENVDKLLAGMQKELVDARAQVSNLEAQIERARAQADHEAEQAKACRRREEMARRIEDTETADLAAEYGAKHERRHALLTQKAAALEEELSFRKRDAEDMLERLKEARTQRDGLAAQAGRTSARGSLSEADDLFAELDRMAEKIEGTERQAEAAQAMEDIDLDEPSDFHVSLDDEPAAPPDVDAALAELKRRMGHED